MTACASWASPATASGPRVIARQTNGTRKFFQGTYRVVDGAIVHSHIRPVLR